jgi:hypothetical protein
MALLQFAKIFDRDYRTVSLRNLLSTARSNPTLFVPYAKKDDLQNLEKQIDSNEKVLEHIKSYRDQRLAHYDQKILKKTSMTFGQFSNLVSDVKDMYVSLNKWHEQVIPSFDFMSRETERHTSDVKRIMCEERDRARLKLLEDNRNIGG